LDEPSGMRAREVAAALSVVAQIRWRVRSELALAAAGALDRKKPGVHFGVDRAKSYFAVSAAAAAAAPPPLHEGSAADIPSDDVYEAVLGAVARAAAAGGDVPEMYASQRAPERVTLVTLAGASWGWRGGELECLYR
jgi:hypothetical protein